MSLPPTCLSSVPSGCAPDSQAPGASYKFWNCRARCREAAFASSHCKRRIRVVSVILVLRTTSLDTVAWTIEPTAVHSHYLCSKSELDFLPVCRGPIHFPRFRPALTKPLCAPNLFDSDSQYKYISVVDNKNVPVTLKGWTATSTLVSTSQATVPIKEPVPAIFEPRESAVREFRMRATNLATRTD